MLRCVWCNRKRNLEWLGWIPSVPRLTGEEAYFKNYKQCILVAEHVSWWLFQMIYRVFLGWIMTGNFLFQWAHKSMEQHSTSHNIRLQHILPLPTTRLPPPPHTQQATATPPLPPPRTLLHIWVPPLPPPRTLQQKLLLSPHQRFSKKFAAYFLCHLAEKRKGMICLILFWY